MNARLRRAVVGDIVAGDVLPVAAGEPPAAIPIIEDGDLDGLTLLILEGAVYVDVHTPEHEPGEARAQLLPPPLATARRR